MVLCAAVALSAVVIAGIAAFLLLPDADRAHQRAVDLWESREPAAYSFDFSYCSGMCMDCPRRVTVTDGRVTDVAYLEPGCSTGQSAPTIEDVFAMEEQERSAELTDSFEIRYDPEWGFPASVEVRCPDGYLDCGTGFSVTNFAVVEGS